MYWILSIHMVQRGRAQSTLESTQMLVKIQKKIDVMCDWFDVQEDKSLKPSKENLPRYLPLSHYKCTLIPPMTVYGKFFLCEKSYLFVKNQI